MLCNVRPTNDEWWERDVRRLPNEAAYPTYYSQGNPEYLFHAAGISALDKQERVGISSWCSSPWHSLSPLIIIVIIQIVISSASFLKPIKATATWAPTTTTTTTCSLDLGIEYPLLEATTMMTILLVKQTKVGNAKQDELAAAVPDAVASLSDPTNAPPTNADDDDDTTIHDYSCFSYRWARDYFDCHQELHSESWVSWIITTMKRIDRLHFAVERYLLLFK